MEKTKYTGVYFRISKSNDKTFYISYRKGGRGAKQVLEPVGKASQGMTAAKANVIRADRLAGKELANTEQRAERQAAIDAEKKRMTVWEIWEQYAEYMQGRSTAKADASRIKYLAPLHSKEPSCITAADISDLTDHLAAATSGRGTPLGAQRPCP